MTLSSTLQLPHGLGLCKSQKCKKQKNSVTSRGKLHIPGVALSSRVSFHQHDPWSSRLSENVHRPICYVPYRYNAFKCHSFQLPTQTVGLSGVKSAGTALMRPYNALQGSPFVVKVASAIGIIAFALWGLGPLMRKCRNLFLHRHDGSWKKSSTYHVTTSFLQPLLLWSGAMLICRAVEPVVLPTEASQIVKQRLLNFVRSLSTVLAFAYCLSGVIQQAQKFFAETSDPSDTRNMGSQFAGRALYYAVWVAAVSLFMELLGFSTQKWLTAGGLGTVLLTLAGREILTNFLSSVMIHAARPFVVNQWIQTKIEGYDVSGTVEHVGWWSPTIIRGEDREAVHIPNHKFTMNVVRNLSQKTHWRLKTHLAISHLDVNKINNIVADMRKVLSKNPQVEQQKLHRRVFLDNIHPETQALMILVSCFVKTSHFEEYLCVKEAILLDLLRVISHHRARLATPIRRVQKIYGDPDLNNTPFTDSSFSRGGVASHRSLLLIEPSYEIKGEDKMRTRMGRTTADQDSKVAAKPATETKIDAKVVAPLSDSKGKDAVASETKAVTKSEALNHEKEELEPVAHNLLPRTGEKRTKTTSSNAVSMTNNKASEAMSSDLKVSVSGSDNSAQKMSDNKQREKSTFVNSLQGSKAINPPTSSLEAGSGNTTGGSAATSEAKPESEKLVAGHPSVSRSSLEENIVLGVALKGSKRTLPIEEGMDLPLSSAEAKELAARGHSSPTAEIDQKDGQNTGNPGKSGDK